MIGVIIRHNDLDGYISGVNANIYMTKVVHADVWDTYVFNHKDKTIDNQIDKAINDLSMSEGDLILVVDGCPSVEKIKELQKTKIKVKIVDHHPKPCIDVIEHLTGERLENCVGEYGNINIAIFTSRKSYTFDENTIELLSSAALLAYIYLIEKNYDKLKHEINFNQLKVISWLTSIYDTFTFAKEPDAVPHMTEYAPQLNSLFGLLGENGLDDFIHPFIYNKSYANRAIVPFPKYLADKIAIKDEIVMKNIDFIMKQLYKKGNEGYIFSNVDTSLLGQIICKKNSDIDIVYIIDMNGNVSLRTTKPNVINCAEIAQKYGGGGHIEAAGFPLKGCKHEGVLQFINSKMQA